MWRTLTRLAAAFALLLVLVAGAGAWLAYKFTVPGPLEQETTVHLPRGLGVAAIGDRLADAGVIDDTFVFEIGARLYSRDRALKAGEYRFEPAVSQRAAVDKIIGGETIVRRLTVPEGLTVAEVLALIAEAEGLSGDVAVSPVEGSLLPETYHYSYGDTREALITRMQAAMAEAMRTLWSDRASDLPIETPYEALILASIVEKETGLAEERPRVAAVFLNRLRRGMRLQSDPTAIYGLTNGAGPLERDLTRADLERDDPFNTYRIDGLPPQPIANPGREAIAAVLQPIESDELYFVADGTGGHAFAKSLAEHNRNVAAYRRIQRERAESVPAATPSPANGADGEAAP